MIGAIGIDEVGRGCWAGPLLVVAARQTGELPVTLTDSKLLSKKKRELLFYDIELVCDIGQGWVQPAEIDELGLTDAMRLAVARALACINAHENEAIIIDGCINYCAAEYCNTTAIIDADALHPIVSAASVYAKVLRDKYMAKQAMRYPQYGFEKHVGYGTGAHITALKQYGICALHRKSYKPIQKLLIDTV